MDDLAFLQIRVNNAGLLEGQLSPVDAKCIQTALDEIQRLKAENQALTERIEDLENRNDIWDDEHLR